MLIYVLLFVGRIGEAHAETFFFFFKSLTPSVPCNLRGVCFDPVYVLTSTRSLQA